MQRNRHVVAAVLHANVRTCLAKPRPAGALECAHEVNPVDDGQSLAQCNPVFAVFASGGWWGYDDTLDANLAVPVGLGQRQPAVVKDAEFQTDRVSRHTERIVDVITAREDARKSGDDRSEAVFVRFEDDSIRKRFHEMIQIRH